MLAVNHAELAELVDALDSGSSGSNAFGVQVPGSASLPDKISFVNMTDR